MRRFDDAYFISDLRKLPLDVLILTQDWLYVILRMVQETIAREVKSRNDCEVAIARLAEYELAGQQAYFMSIHNPSPLPQNAHQSQKSLSECANIIHLQNPHIWQETILLHAKSFKERVRLQRNEKIAALKAAGFTAREIGLKLGISPSTAHRVLKSRILKKKATS